MKVNYKMMLTLCAAVTVLTLGCSSVKPLKLSNTSRNIVITADNHLKIENDYINYKDLKGELIRRLITNNTMIIIHVHEKASQKAFDTLYEKLESEGFKKLDFEMYNR